MSTPSSAHVPVLLASSQHVVRNACRMVAAEADRYRRGEPPAHCANPDGGAPVSEAGG